MAREPHPMLAGNQIPVPRSLERKLEALKSDGHRHPGLMLDKFLVAGKQEQQKEELRKVVKLTGFPDLLLELNERRRGFLKTLGADAWVRETSTPLTLGLARTAILENAGITLHPIHGFAYLPGTGLKGMARAFAETIWLREQPDQADGKATIERVFGWASPTASEPKKSACAGSIIFHDAWPESWPELVIDIVNSHHPTYYQGKGPPGDWDSPIPVSFLAIPPGQRFQFAIGPRRLGEHAEEAELARQVELARQWLEGGLTHLGFGAKTTAGYGYFRAEGDAARPLPAIARDEQTVTLESITPAFLAGAEQGEKDCELRSATLRGQLRWWWRTLHAGFLDWKALRELEAALWGDTEASGLIQTIVVPGKPSEVRLFNYKDRFDPRPDFKRAHQLADRPDNKTTQGLFYAAYGMDEVSRGERKQRFYLEPGGTWSLRLIARDPRGLPGEITRTDALNQARAALWLLCHFGAVGSKARKGFGSLQTSGEALEGFDLEHCRKLGREFREKAKLPNTFDPVRLESSSLERAEILGPAPLTTPWSDPWQALDQLGFAYQAFAKRYKHDSAKASLGLPRKIHGPSDRGAMRGQAHWQRPRWLGLLQTNGQEQAGPNIRYASPVHFHLGRSDRGTLTIQAIAFAAPRLPDLEQSLSFLQEFLAHLRSDLDRRMTTVAPAAGSDVSRRRGPAKRDSGTPALVKILGPKGAGFRVQEAGKPEGSLTVGTCPEPPPAEGAEVSVEIHNDEPNHPQYRWPDPKAKKRQGPPRRRPGRPRRW